MVSTRQCSTKFSVGETVLCYEPDSSKAKVLYESKILEVDFTKDERGRKVPEYFVHFSGWNKSWDRWVLEDQVLEGNEVNRLKMKRLHEEAINRLKSKKKRKSYMSILDNTPQSSSETVSLTPPPQPPSTPGFPSVPCIEIEIPSSLKVKLEDDCYFIKRRKKGTNPEEFPLAATNNALLVYRLSQLVRLPRSPNVIDILKEYIDHFTRQADQSITEVRSSVKIVKEVMDGLRIYFDFTLPTLLLYNFERDQYEQVMGVPLGSTEGTNENDLNVKEHRDERSTAEVKVEEITENVLGEANQEKNGAGKPRKQTSSPENPEEIAKQDDTPSDRVLRRRSRRQKTSAISASTSSTSTVSSSGGEREESLNASFNLNEKTSGKGVKRKLSETASNQDLVSVNPLVEDATTNVLSDTSTTDIPKSSIRTTPCQVYGAEHLLRLFVKLPSLLAKTTIQENRLSLLLQHLTDFLKYLSSRSNTFFSEDAYEEIIL